MTEELPAHPLKVLVGMMERGEKVGQKTNAELAQILVDLTERSRIDSYFYLVMMECAYRLAPEIFPPDEE